MRMERRGLHILSDPVVNWKKEEQVDQTKAKQMLGRPNGPRRGSCRETPKRKGTISPCGRKMKFGVPFLSIVFTFFFVAPLVTSQQSLAASHTEANVPESSVFDRYLKRDLEEYFETNLEAESQLSFEFLRDGPTQSGVAYPKYYVWVRILHSNENISEWAVRLAAMEKTHFKVTHAVSRQEVEGKKVDIFAIFPRAVCEEIDKRLRDIR